MKVYYDKSTNGEIIASVAVLLFLFIICVPNDWLYVLIYLGWIPIGIIVFCIIDRRKYYITSENNNIVFVRKIKKRNIKKEIVSIEKDKIINYYIQNRKLFILTKNQEYIVDDFYVSLLSIESLFE